MSAPIPKFHIGQSPMPPGPVPASKVRSGNSPAPASRQEKEQKPKPIAIEPQLDRIPLELRERNQWVVWRYDWEDGRWNKTPYNPLTRYKAKSTDPNTWSSFDLAKAVYRRSNYDGVGYVFSPDDSYCGVDFDHIFTDIDGEKVIHPDAKRWVEAFDSYTEYSVSGKGLHTIIRANPSSNFKNDEAGRELYSRARYFCFTGDSFHDQPLPIAERQEVAEDFIREFDPKLRKGQVGLAPLRSARTGACGGGGLSLETNDEKEGHHTTTAQVSQSRSLPLTLKGISYDPSNSFEKWKAELILRLSTDPSARWNGSGNIDIQASCHQGEGGKGLFINPRKNRVSCNKRCSISRIAEAFGYFMPPNHELKNGTKKTVVVNINGTWQEVDAQAKEDKNGEGKQVNSANSKPKVKSGTQQASGNSSKDVEDVLSRIMPAQTIIDTKYPDQKWAVKGLIPQGTTLIVGPPKLGKSLFVTNIAVAVAEGEKALSHFDVDQGSVLYLALEDSPRRIQERLIKLRGGTMPDKLEIVTEWPRLNQGGLEAIDEWINRHSDARLLIVDTLKKLRPVSRGRNVYDEDYEAIDPLTKVAALRVGLMLVHHSRKAEADDVLAEVSGSYGLTGAADGVLILKRRRNRSDATLSVIGRDVAEQELALDFKPDTCLWSVLGKTEEVHPSKERKEILDLIRQAGVPLSPGNIAELLDKSPGAIRAMLFKLKGAGDIKLFGSKYQLPDYRPPEPDKIRKSPKGKNVTALPITNLAGNAGMSNSDNDLGEKRYRVTDSKQHDEAGKTSDGVNTGNAVTNSGQSLDSKDIPPLPVKNINGNAVTFSEPQPGMDSNNSVEVTRDSLTPEMELAADRAGEKSPGPSPTVEVNPPPTDPEPDHDLERVTLDPDPQTPVEVQVQNPDPDDELREAKEILRRLYKFPWPNDSYRPLLEKYSKAIESGVMSPDLYRSMRSMAMSRGVIGH